MFGMFYGALLVTIDCFKRYLSIYPVQLGIFVFQGTAGLPVQPGMSPTVHSKEPQVPRSTWNVINCAFQGTAGVFDLSDIDNKEEPI